MCFWGRALAIDMHRFADVHRRSSMGPGAATAPSARGGGGGPAATGAPSSNTEAAAARRGSRARGGNGDLAAVVSVSEQRSRPDAEEE